MATTTSRSLLSAALRHLRDAEYLADSHAGQSLNQAEHLVGFAPECARKACLSARWPDKLISHDLSSGAESLLDLAISLDAYANRYPIKNWSAVFPGLTRWNPAVRYQQTARKTADVSALNGKVRTLLGEAKQAVDSVLIGLYVDGQLDPLGDL
jgi:hypothetical protein